MSDQEKDPRIETDRDYIVSKKYNNSLSLLLKSYPDGVPDKIICKTLQISQEELEKIKKNAIIRLKRSLI